MDYSPLIDSVEASLCHTFPVRLLQVLTHPGNKVVFESPLYQLMKEIWGNELVDVGVREVVCKGLAEAMFHDKYLTRT